MRRPRSVSPLRAIVLIAAHHEDARELFGSVPTDSRLWPLCASASGSLACEHSAEAALLSFVQAREKRRRRSLSRLGSQREKLTEPRMLLQRLDSLLAAEGKLIPLLRKLTCWAAANGQEASSSSTLSRYHLDQLLHRQVQGQTCSVPYPIKATATEYKDSRRLSSHVPRKAHDTLAATFQGLLIVRSSLAAHPRILPKGYPSIECTNSIWRTHTHTHKLEEKQRENSEQGPDPEFLAAGGALDK
ncbi:hypothetical protein TgHK011_001401 [Trichoderma gracile]|nr:hypothetical protein TgHK011_001401 [Trichoderma gracile]